MIPYCKISNKLIVRQMDRSEITQSYDTCCKAYDKSHVLWNYITSCFQTHTCANFSIHSFSKCNTRTGKQDILSDYQISLQAWEKDAVKYFLQLESQLTDLRMERDNASSWMFKNLPMQTYFIFSGILISLAV